MKRIDINKNYFNSIRSLSCIESYFLYILNFENFSYKHLYAYSYAGFGEICHAFISENMKYAYFSGVPRIQETAQRLGLVILESIETPNLLRTMLDNNSYFCIKIKPDFIEKHYQTNLWRKDHYILITDYDGRFWSYLNDNPRDSGRLTNEEIFEAFDNKILKIQLITDLTKFIREKLLTVFLKSIEQLEEPYSMNIADNINITDNIISIRDAIGVLRILRRRLYEYCSLYTECEFIVEYLRELDRKYSILEYMRLRNRLDSKKISDVILSLQKADYCIIQSIRERMRFPV